MDIIRTVQLLACSNAKLDKLELVKFRLEVVDEVVEHVIMEWRRVFMAVEFVESKAELVP